MDLSTVSTTQTLRNPLPLRCILLSALSAKSNFFSLKAMLAVYVPLVLLFVRFVAAVKLLGCNGHLVLKMFTLFEHHSLSLLALASCLFQKVKFLFLILFVRQHETPFGVMSAHRFLL